LDTREIDSDEARIHFPSLLNAVERGESVLITRNERAVARLIPVVSTGIEVAKTIADMKRRRLGRRLGSRVRPLIENERR